MAVKDRFLASKAPKIFGTELISPIHMEPYSYEGGGLLLHFGCLPEIWGDPRNCGVLGGPTINVLLHFQ